MNDRAINEAAGEAVRRCREEAGFTQQQVTIALEITIATQSRRECGHVAMSGETLMDYAELCDVPCLYCDQPMFKIGANARLATVAQLVGTAKAVGLRVSLGPYAITEGGLIRIRKAVAK